MTDWNVHIEDGYDKEPEVTVRQATPDYRIIFITCGTWEEAEKIHDEILQKEED